MRHLLPAATACLALGLAVAGLPGCGARTPLPYGEEAQAAAEAGAPDAPAAVDAAADAPVLDAPADVSRDAPKDVAVDPPVDAREEDALPPIDASPERDAPPSICPDAGSTLVYLIGTDDALYSFYPPTASFSRIGTIACPSAPGQTPFSMAVDRKGTAYVLFNDGNLFEVSTATAACKPTPFVPTQLALQTFGMGFAANLTDDGETLYVAGDGTQLLATLDVTTFLLSEVGPITVPRAELTGTSDGRLFAFYADDTGTQSRVGELDRATAALSAETKLPTVDQGNAWAFAAWGGDFYLFTAPNMGGTTVQRFRPADGSVVTVASTGSTIVGAGVSTCAPQ